MAYQRRRSYRRTSRSYGGRRYSRGGSYRRSAARRRVSRRSASRTVRIVVQTVAAAPAAIGMKSMVPVRARF